MIGKKGLFYIDSIVALISLFIIFLVMTIFFFLFVFMEPSESQKIMIEDHDLPIFMDNILNTPVGIDNMTVYKALLYWASDPKYGDLVEEKLKEILKLAEDYDEVITEDGLKRCFTVYELYINTNKRLSTFVVRSPSLFRLNKYKGCYGKKDNRENVYAERRKISYGNIEVKLILSKYVLRE